MMKAINYHGMTFEVEDHFRYIATDSDGDICVYEKEPRYNGKYEMWFANGGDYKKLERNFKQAGDSLENI